MVSEKGIMLIINFVMILIMFIGLICTIAPRLYGTLIILVAASIYVVIIGVNVLQPWVTIWLIALTVLSEIVIRCLRIFTTNKYPVTRIYSTDTTVCNIGGIIATDVLLGSLLGVTVWELLVGKSLLPRFDTIAKVLLWLNLMALLRFICGLTMIIIIIKYLMYAT